jgi:hypothetical protein
VVVASFRAPEHLEACLDSLDDARAGVPVDVFVARPGSGDEVRHLFRDRPWAHLVPAPAGADVPRLRGAAMVAAGGGWVAVTEDHCVVAPDWLEVISGELDGSCQILGGGMGNARPGPLNWGAYFSEYGFFSSARPRAEGDVLVTGANAVYGPEISADTARWATEGCWEDVIHQRLGAVGVRRRFVPGARVLQNTTYRLGPFCVDRYEHGYDYARVRVAENPEVSRVVRAGTTPLLPFLLGARVARAAAGENVMAFTVALPFTLIFLTAWAVGEAMGYIKGPEA